MKKTLTYTVIGILVLLASSGFGFTLAANDVNSSDTDNLETIATKNTDENLNTTPLKQLSSKDESVYIITNDEGTAEKTFIGSNLYTGDESLPVTLNITYYLSGSKISASELAGKSGHVKIVYHYTATATHQDELVPFLAATGLQLDSTKFSNVKLSNGKIISEKNNYIIVGYSFAGLNENLGTDLLPGDFILEADVTNFELDNTYAFATNSLIAELDISKLNSVDNIVSSINQLSDGFNQIIAGAGQLDNGIDALASGISELQSGASTLNSGANQLATGINTLSGGAHELATGAKQLSVGLNRINDINSQVMSYVNPVTDAIDAEILVIRAKIAALAETNPELAAELTKVLDELVQYYDKAHTAVIDYTDGVAALTDGAGQLSAGLDTLATGSDELAYGANQLASGTAALKDGIDQLASGSQQLSNGSKTLYAGLQTFKTSGIDQLTSFANDNLASFTANFRASIDAASSYHSYGNVDAKTVKFIFKTPSIK